MSTHDELNSIGARMYGHTDDDAGARMYGGASHRSSTDKAGARVYGNTGELNSIGARVYDGGTGYGAAKAVQQDDPADLPYPVRTESVLPQAHSTLDLEALGKRVTENTGRGRNHTASHNL